MQQKQSESVPASKRKNRGGSVTSGRKKQRSMSTQDSMNQRPNTMMTQTPFDPLGSFSSSEFSSSSSRCFLSTDMATPKKHVEEIRRTKFSIGGEPNPLIEDLHQAVKNLSAELYAKDVHFLMELIQNAEDNQYEEGVDPSLEFIITSRDITATGAPATLLIFNNEKGFSPRNIESICSVGRSTKKGNRSSGYIGEKGIGFKSVFLITAQPYIFSNGYQIRLNEEPCPQCGLGYIVPEWVDDNPTLVDLKQIYRAGDALPTTTIVLPLKPDKVQAVKKQLSCIHPEVLLFLSKIKQLSVKEDTEDPNLNTISTVAISSEIDFKVRENINAESYVLRLSAEENDDSVKECSYFMWKQKFPVRPDNRVERRMDVDEWVITLAFPNQERLNRGTILSGVYAFLPTEMVTNFPFIIQADFVLASSRETVLLDDKWNQGILNCVPSAFMDALKALVITGDGAPISSVPRMFEFLPISSSSYPALNDVREKIKAKVAKEKIVPIESYNDQKRFYKPCEVGRLNPAFWVILKKAQHHGVSLHNLSSHGIYILNSSFDRVKYDPILKFLGVKAVNNEWYAKCIQSSNLVQGVPEDAYLELLLFVANGWVSRFQGSNMTKIPLIKYVGSSGGVYCLSVNECARSNSVSLADRNQSVSWLIDWNQEFRGAFTRYFLPESTQQAIRVFHQRPALSEWLQNHANISTMNVYYFANRVCNSIRNDSQLAVVYAHFLYHSFSKGYISQSEVENLCRSMPLVDNYGNVAGCRVGVLVPADVSKWVELMVSNPWRSEGYVELGKEYLLPGRYAGQSTREHGLLDFLKSYVRASDIPHISPPNAWFSAGDTPLNKKNAFLILEWIQSLKRREIQIPTRFLECIKEGSWLRVVGNRCRPPSHSFLIDLGSPLGKILQSGSALVDIALVDQSFYGDKINEYKEELRTVGVMFSFEEACQFIGEELMSRAASSHLSRGLVLLILKFMQYLRKSLLPLDQFVYGIKKESWLRMSGGNYRSPVGSVLYDSGWQTAEQISDIPFIDQEYYGEDINQFKEELKLLGVIVGFDRSYQVVIDHLKSTSHLKSLTPEAVVLILECVHFSNNSATLVDALRETKWLKTKKMGFREPRECYLYDPEWGCILDVFNDFPVIDHDFYGAKLFSYKSELKQAGVIVDFEDTIKAFASVFERKAKESSFNKQHVLSFLLCCRLLKKNGYIFPKEFTKILNEAKWLRTRLYNDGFRSPGGCILFGPEWESISPIVRFPFIDDSDNFYGKGIHEFKEELESVGVITELKAGVKFIPTCLRFPSDPSTITPGNVLSLLKCIRLILPEHIHTLEAGFIKRLSENCLKTHAGYRSPDQCLLFDSKWNLYLKPTDGPFIDENFYGPEVASYKRELRAMGVTVDMEKGCSLIASHLPLLSEFSTIEQTYRYLSDYNWKPKNEADQRIWIPSGMKNGEWVNPDSCIIHDNDHLFGSRFYILEKYYDKKLLPLFSVAMDVRQRPSVDDYIELWKKWECSGVQLSNSECCKFWIFILKHWNLKTEKMLAESLMKLPARSGSERILLLNKQDVFVADNLHLSNLFEQERVFVWYPQPSMAELPMSKLLDVYRQIGVRTFSQSVEKVESSLPVGVEQIQVDPKNYFIGKVLVKLILGFLACSSLKMVVEKRLGAVQGLLDLTVYETREPATVSYSLSLSSGAVFTKKENRMIRWETESSKFFTQKMDWCSGSAIMIKYAKYFSEAISVGVLRENIDHIRALSELIKLAFVMKFEEEAVKFLMEDNNLQIFLEDEEFLSSAFPSD